MSVQTSIELPTGGFQKIRWVYWHLVCLHDAMCNELQHIQPDDIRWFPEEYTFQADHEYVNEINGEVFPIAKSSTYRTWR